MKASASRRGRLGWKGGPMISEFLGREVGCICEVCDWQLPPGADRWRCPYGGPFTGYVDTAGNRLPSVAN